MNPNISPLRIAVLSFAHGHANAYCEAISQMPDAEVVAAWDSDVKRGQNACEKWNLQWESSLQVLAAREDIHAVIITSETNRHRECVEAATAHGKHILCQKPLATTIDDCDAIIAAVEQSGVHFQMAFQMRCDPLNQQIKQWIDSGEVGRVGMMRRRHCINFLFNAGLKDGPNAWHIDPVANVGMFFDDAVHAADFLYWLHGKPQSVMAEIDNVLTNIAPDDTGLAIYRWNDGAMASLCNASVTLAGENTCEIYGDKGVIIQNWDDGVSTPHAPQGVAPLKLWRKSTNQWEAFVYVIPSAHAERLKAVPRPWIENLLNNRAPDCDARDGKISVEMCLAAYESAREGKRISL